MQVWKNVDIQFELYWISRRWDIHKFVVIARKSRTGLSADNHPCQRKKVEQTEKDLNKEIVSATTVKTTDRPEKTILKENYVLFF